ncbi:MAG: sugar transferase [Bacteroidetes bacterium]|nr:sugar transferase [Bacteroidota bacterium]
MKRIFDVLFSLTILLLFMPIWFPVMVLIWLYDFHNPFYIASRMAKNQGKFKMIKFRSMRINADKSGVNSTSGNDNRITPIGKYVRKFKLDEISQFFNVLLGDMSVVGPRPQVETDAKMYTSVENKMLEVRPGITDLASIVFADEGDILAGSDNPDLLYNQIIRPFKSRLALLTIEKSNLILDIKIILLTAINIFNRKKSLQAIHTLLVNWNSDEILIEIVKREKKLYPFPPPGSDSIVSSYPMNS